MNLSTNYRVIEKYYDELKMMDKNLISYTLHLKSLCELIISYKLNGGKKDCSKFIPEVMK